jgi:hypothetical protein
VLLVTTRGGVFIGQPAQPPRLWDLRQSRTKENVRWQSAAEVWSIDHVDVMILLPGRQTFVGPGINAILAACRDPEQLWQVALYWYPARTLDEVYRQAKQLTQEWRMDTAEVEAWYQGVQVGRRARIKDSNEAFSAAGMGGKPLAPGGPAPSAAMLSSFDEARPAFILFRFAWSETFSTCET